MRREKGGDGHKTPPATAAQTRFTRSVTPQGYRCNSLQARPDELALLVDLIHQHPCWLTFAPHRAMTLAMMARILNAEGCHA